ncbi:uncharacterized protein LOC114541312 isoform X1 [Dendronephthya gigantea]|uniref:uncharacterized protein LOC114541312 isoform X1 n=1 Tax=Dendronephthya gigantea TaxID=151771 RepID=UPI00106A5778|nr:uncharacterized protein LOC114541312 isoform X1 [Dendronephthya gigantea]
MSCFFILDAAKLDGISEKIQKLQSDVTSVKRSIASLAENQQELLSLIKKLRKNVEADTFDMGKCCHTENLIQLLGKFYTTKGRFSLDTPEKERALKLEFTNSPTGLSLQELGLRYKKFESAKLSYWRSEERRRLLGIAGYDMLINAPTEQVTAKILQLIGQKHSNGCHRALLEDEIIITRKFIRETGLEGARKAKDFWGAYYQWKTSNWPTGLSQEDKFKLRKEDMASYQN